jgi:hypothetical protein
MVALIANKLDWVYVRLTIKLRLFVISDVPPQSNVEVGDVESVELITRETF